MTTMNPNLVYKAIMQNNPWGKNKTAYWIDAGQASLRIEVSEKGVEVEIYDNAHASYDNPPKLKINFSDFDIKFTP